MNEITRLLLFLLAGSSPLLSPERLHAEQKEQLVVATVSLVLPVNPDDPAITVKYHNQGKAPVRLTLPALKGTGGAPLHTDIRVTVDTHPPESNGGPDWGTLFIKGAFREVDLEPGQSTVVDVRLAKICKLKKDWRIIEVRPVLYVEDVSVIKGTLRVER